VKRILVIGSPGSGKSTFSRELNRIKGIPLFHLDMLFWNADKTTVEKEVFCERLSDVLKKPSWVIDGNYGSTLEERLQACDTVFFLDYPTEVCLDGVRARRGKPRLDMPWIETEEDEEFMDYIRTFKSDKRPMIVELLDKYRDKNIVIFKSREEGDAFLKRLSEEKKQVN